MTLSERLGRYQYLRGKSQWYIEAIRAWVMPGSAAGAFAKYLGLPGRWSLVIAVGVPLAVEAAGFLLGRFLWQGGGVRAEYQMALERDPYKTAQMEFQERVLVLLTKIEKRLAENDD